jgi:hypothetical protein
MRDNAARALRADDEMPRHRAELRSVDTIEDAYAELRARASERRFERTPRQPAPTAVALEEPVRETVSLPRTAPGRSYGSHRRADGFVPAARVAGAQPGRRTVEITGQVQAPRRRSQTTTAFQARPDRAALWAFMLALFLIVMAVATAHG